MRGRAIAGIGAIVAAAVGGGVVVNQNTGPRTLRTAGQDTVEANFPIIKRAGWYSGNRLLGLATAQKTTWETGDPQSLEPLGAGRWLARRVGVVQVCANSEGQKACTFVTIYPPIHYPKVWWPSDSTTPEDSLAGCARIGFGKFLRQSHDTAYFDYEDSTMAKRWADTTDPHHGREPCVPYNMYMAVYQTRDTFTQPRIFYPDPAPTRPGYKPYGEDWRADTAFVGRGRKFGYGGG